MNIKSFVVVVVLFSFTFLGLGAYLDRPTVEVSIDTGHCVRAYGPKGPMPCADALAGRYEKVIVSPQHSQKVPRG